MSDIYVMDDIELDENVTDAINTALVTTMGDIRQQQIDSGPTEYVQPHMQLLEISALVGALRMQQCGLETLLGELAGEDQVFSDSWLTISSSLHALDSVFDQLYILTKVYTGVIDDLASTPALITQLADKADEIVAKTTETSPGFAKIYSEYLSNGKVNADQDSEDDNP